MADVIMNRRICPECKKEFTTNHYRKIYCNKSCRNKQHLKQHPGVKNHRQHQESIHRTQLPKVCPICTKEFFVDILHINQKYCSRECGRRFTCLNRKKIYTSREIQCGICGKSFIEMSKRNKKYCSPKCENKAHSMRYRKKINDSDNGEIEKLYRAGTSMVAIASRFDISDNAVRRRLIKLGVPLRNPHLSEHSSNWKGGRRITKNGYVEVLNPDYRNTSKSYYIHEHRLVWEKTYGKKIPKGYVVHHLNGVKDDNRPENLVAMKIGEHLNQAEPYKKKIRELEEKIRSYQQNNLFNSRDIRTCQKS